MNYEEQIARIDVYLRNHLNEPLNLEQTARLAHCSPFHFHRVFKAMTGETLKAFSVRIRMEHAATLIKNTDYPVAEISQRVGFDFPESFSRTFQRHFGESPSQFRSRQRPVFQKQVTDVIRSRVSDHLIPVTFRTLKPTTLICVTHQGEYEEVGGAWNKLFQSVRLNRMPQTIGVTYSDPAITEAVKIRYDACFRSEDVQSFEPPAFERHLSGGKYAVARHQGPYQKLNETYELLYGLWLPNSFKRLRDEPALEHYLNDPKTTRPEELLTEILLPIE